MNGWPRGGAPGGGGRAESGDLFSKRSQIDLPSLPIVMPSDTPMVLNCQASMPCFSTALLTILPMSITSECQSVRIPGSTTPRVSPLPSAYGACCYSVSESEGIMSEATRGGLSWLTCKGFLPTIQLRYQHAGRSSWPGRQALQRHIAWPFCGEKISLKAPGPGCDMTD